MNEARILIFFVDIKIIFSRMNYIMFGVPNFDLYLSGVQTANFNGHFRYLNWRYQ